MGTIKTDNPIRYSMVSYLGFEKAKEDAKIRQFGIIYAVATVHPACRCAPHTYNYAHAQCMVAKMCGRVPGDIDL